MPLGRDGMADMSLDFAKGRGLVAAAFNSYHAPTWERGGVTYLLKGVHLPRHPHHSPGSTRCPTDDGEAEAAGSDQRLRAFVLQSSAQPLFSWAQRVWGLKVLWCAHACD